MKTNQNKLKNTLLSNSVFSGACGIFLILFPHQIAEIFLLNDSLVIQIIGGALLLFWVQLVAFSLQNPIPTWGIKGIIIQDLMWVLGSLIILFWNPFSFPSIGLWMIISVACIVLMFAILQWKFLNKN